MVENTDILTRLLKCDQLFVLISVIILVALSWMYIFHLSSLMSSDFMEGMTMPQMWEWSFKDFSANFAMWSVMMIAMMLPSATPMILIFSNVNKKRNEHGNEFVPTWIFVSSYITLWIAFSLFATIVQWFLHHFALLSDGLRIISPSISGLLLISAGVYQFTSVKYACLKNCQSPLGFIWGNWRYGKQGALSMGLKHGLYCIGCCWVLMILLFLVGIMNILWIAVISIFIFIEKIIARGRLLSYFSGSILVLWGLWLLI